MQSDTGMSVFDVNVRHTGNVGVIRKQLPAEYRWELCDLTLPSLNPFVRSFRFE